MSGMLDEATTAVRETGTRIKDQAVTAKDKAGTAAGKAGKRIRDVLPGHTETKLQRLTRVTRTYLGHAAKAIGLAAALGAATATVRRKRHGDKHPQSHTDDTTK
jgi:hypothetical protein